MKFLRKPAVIVPSLLWLLLELGCGGQYRPVANPILSHGGQPQNLHAAFVVSYNPLGNGSNTQIDVSGDTNIQVLTMGPGSIVESYQGGTSIAIFIANRDGDSVSEFPLIGTITVSNVALHPGSRPVSLAASASNCM